MLTVVGVDDGDPTGEARPVVQITAGQRSEAIDAAEAHLVERDVGIFQRGEFVVRVAPQEVDVGGGERVSALRIVRIGKEHMRDRFNQAVDLRRWDQKAKEWRSIDCPAGFAESYLERVGLWRLPVLHSVSTVPVLRPDGTIAERPGFDRASGVFYDPRGVSFPAISGVPTRSAALQALDRLEGLLGTFDFLDAVSRSVALSAILTPLFRRPMSAAPLHGFTAPVAGSGKSKLVNLAAILATGHYAPVTALGKDDAETEKRLGAIMMAGDAIASIDNAERPVGGEFLCQAVTEPLVNARILGTSSRLVSPNAVSWYATGNNLKFVGDMTRRGLLCRLDPRCERPELREFETPDPCITALRERPVLVACALTIARAFAVAGFPRDRAPLGSFADWSRWVRDALIWLGRADPLDAMTEARREDPRLTALAAVLEQWAAVIRDERVTARAVAECAAQQGMTGYSHPDLREALLAVASDRGEVSARRLGRWLGEVKGRQVNGKYIESAGMRDGFALWQLRGLG